MLTDGELREELVVSMPWRGHNLSQHAEDALPAQTSFLSKMPDFHRISKRFQKGVANLEDVVRVYQAVLLLPGLTTLFESGGQAGDNERWTALLHEHYLGPLREYGGALEPLREMVEETIDLDELDRHQYVIKAEFDETLAAIKGKLEGVRDRLDNEHRRVATDLDMDMDGKVLHFEQHSLYGYCFRLTRKVRFQDQLATWSTFFRADLSLTCAF